MTIRIGISGWTYSPWRGAFFPADLPQRAELAYAAATFPAIEINGTFYGLQRPASFRRWRQETPARFQFAIKASRYITHIRRLRDIETPLANFLAQGLFALGPRLGPILWQFPPSFKYERDLMARFFALLPRNAGEAELLAARADREGDQLRRAEGRLRFRHAIEVRHSSFCTADFVNLARGHNIAIVMADSPDWPVFAEATADFIYARLHGSEQLYASGYSGEALENWASKIKTLTNRGRRDAYVFFDNDMKVKAPFDALELAKILKVDAVRPQHYPQRHRNTASNLHTI